jgi:hypothetical protein
VPTRKQIRRERKRRVHGYETESLPGDSPAGVAERPNRKPARARVTTSVGPLMVGRRKVYPPSWRRAAAKVGVFVAIFLVLIQFVGAKQTPLQIGIQAMYLAAIGIPATYYIDRFVYRRAQRRFGR